MSKLVIKYMNNSKNERDITGINVIISDEFLEIHFSKDRIHYIPLANVKEFYIKGYNQLKRR